jgi:zinc transport system substrate-binding protein
MRIIPMKVLVLLVLSPLLVACGGSDSGKLRVETAFYPFAFVAEQVGGADVEVDSLTSPGVEPHDLELRPKQVGAVQTADLVVYQRHFQAAVDDAVDQAGRKRGTTIDVAKLVDARDPHTWLDPATMVTLTAAVRDHLVELDPDHAAAYRANADRLTAALMTLDRDLRAGLAHCERDTIVTSHEAFGHLAKRYGLTQVPIAGVDPSAEPSPAQLASISRLVEKQHVTTIFTEELVSPAIADAIARETGARTATLDPIEGLSDDTSDQTYLTLMRQNLEAIRKANACS